MTISILTIFPHIFDSFFQESILGRAIASQALAIRVINIRDYSDRKHKNTDDEPFGGGPGMVMLAQPIVDAVEDCVGKYGDAKRILMSPKGKRFIQKDAERLSAEQHIILICGHYEGVDQRAIDLCVDEELSIGDFILTGGEVAALAVTDSIARLIPGVLGCSASAQDESFTSGLLEYPQYTRPREFRGLSVPEVLLNGNHAKITKWKREEALRVTHQRRPELLQNVDLTQEEARRIQQWGKEKSE